jgi:hypothetical protein
MQLDQTVKGLKPFPIATLEPDSLAELARLVTGAAPGPGVLLGQGAAPPGLEPPERPEPLEALRAFAATASPGARELATYLAAVPAITLPIARLLGLHRPQGRWSRLEEAEVWLSGLLRPLSSAAEEDPDTIVYDFGDGIRDHLFDALSRPKAVEVLEVSINAFLEEHLDGWRWEGLRRLAAMIKSPSAHRGQFLPAGGPIARIAAHILRRIGGPWRALIVNDLLTRILDIHAAARQWSREGWIGADWFSKAYSENQKTVSYIDLVFAFCLARLGEAEATRGLLSQATDELLESDDAHQSLLQAFKYRIEQALAGKPHAGPLPRAWREQLQGVDDRLMCYLVDFIRRDSRVLEPQERINPIRNWASFLGGLHARMAELHDLNDPAQAAEGIRMLLRTVSDNQSTPEVSLDILVTVLPYTLRAGEAVALETLQEVSEALEAGIRWADSGIEPGARDAASRAFLIAQVLERAITLSGSLSRVEHVQVFVQRLLDFLEEKQGSQLLGAMDLIAEPCLRTLLRLGLRGEIPRVLDRMAEWMEWNVGLEALRDRYANKWPGWPQALRALLRLAEGWLLLGQPRHAEAILEEARRVLFAHDLDTHPREYTELVCVYATALGELPGDDTLNRFQELFANMKPVRDTYTSSNHFSVMQLRVVESVVLSLCRVDCLEQPEDPSQ